jgi:SAM-dependent methyltransferase
MFEKSARFYDALYSWKDYEAEAAKIHALVQERRPGAKRLLDVACGKGIHLGYLSRHYEAEGLDLESDFVKLAQERLAGVPIHHADMLDFALGRTFDVVTCLFSSIGYAVSVEDLFRAVANMASHVSEDGLLLEPWFTSSDFQTGNPWALFVDEPDIKIARMDVPQVEGTASVITFHYLVATREGIEHFTERHKLGLFTGEEYVAAFEGVGLDVEHDPEGLIGRASISGPVVEVFRGRQRNLPKPTRCIRKLADQEVIVFLAVAAHDPAAWLLLNRRGAYASAPAQTPARRRQSCVIP